MKYSRKKEKILRIKSVQGEMKMFQGKVFKSLKIMEMIRANNGAVKVFCMGEGIYAEGDCDGILSREGDNFFITIDRTFKLHFDLNDVAKMNPPGIVITAHDKKGSLSLKMKLKPMD